MNQSSSLIVKLGGDHPVTAVRKVLAPWFRRQVPLDELARTREPRAVPRRLQDGHIEEAAHRVVAPPRGVAQKQF